MGIMHNKYVVKYVYFPVVIKISYKIIKNDFNIHFRTRLLYSGSEYRVIALSKIYTHSCGFRFVKVVLGNFMLFSTHLHVYSALKAPVKLFLMA